ncbi:glycosyltransferase family 39 protein [Speluncibacter jeojiensis]|uniref:glycosyltransferase family 39 protein n=1 Tax=Speluncibacter jeojiensis TaxID=2710754 RepID=UPI00240F2E76|nr:glycosyltransferase family 39 protein [Rhodococcus sp. D2-41]
MTSTTDPTPLRIESGRRHAVWRRGRALDAVTVGLIGFVLGVIGSWRPSLWYDEVATVHSATRTLPQLHHFLENQDAVHGLYYVVMHFWFELFGASPLSARIPSAIGVGVAAAGVVVLGTRLGTRRFGLLSGLVFVVLPRVTWAAVEARSYAWTMAAAVWLTVLFCAAIRATTGRSGLLCWLGYALGVTFSTVLFLYSATLLIAHALTLLVVRAPLRTWRRWAAACLAGLVVASPLVRLMVHEHGQVAWIPALDRHAVRSVLGYQWFLEAPVCAALAWILMLAALAFTRRRTLPGVRVVMIPWALAPTATLVAASLLWRPIYLDRYLTFTTPAVALLLGWALLQFSAHAWVSRLGFAVLAAAALPAYVGQRGEYPKPSGMDFTSVNDYLATHTSPGDCLLFDPKPAWNPTSARLAKDADPGPLAGLRDLELGRTAASQGSLWDEDLPLAQVQQQLPSCPTVWYVADIEREVPEHIRHTSNEQWGLPSYHFVDTDDYRRLAAHGFRIVDRREFHVSQVVELKPTEAAPR